MRQPATPKVLTRGNPDSRTTPSHGRLRVKQPQLTPRNIESPTRTVRDPSGTSFANTWRQETLVGKMQGSGTVLSRAKEKGTIFQELEMKFNPLAKAEMQGEITYSPPGESFMEKHKPRKVSGRPRAVPFKRIERIPSSTVKELKAAKSQAKLAPGELKSSLGEVKKGSEIVGKKGKSGKEKLEAVMTKRMYREEYNNVKSLYPNLSDEEAAQMVLDTHHEVESYKERKMQEDIKDINAEAELRKIESQKPVTRKSVPLQVEEEKPLPGEAKSITQDLHFVKRKYPKDFKKEKSEHPEFKDSQVAQIVLDHKRKK